MSRFSVFMSGFLVSCALRLLIQIWMGHEAYVEYERTHPDSPMLAWSVMLWVLVLACWLYRASKKEN